MGKAIRNDLVGLLKLFYIYLTVIKAFAPIFC